MKLFFTILHDGLFRFYDGSIRYLADQGHQITIAIEKGQREKIKTDAALQACIDDVNGLSVQLDLLRRRGLWHLILTFSRGIIGFQFANRPDHPWSLVENSDRLYKPLPQPLRDVAERSRLIRKLLLAKPLYGFMKWVERIAPPSRNIVALLAAEQPDVMMSAPFIYIKSVDIEYVKAAQSLGIPTAVGITSWDHLTTKDTFHLMPDLILVWNKWLYEDALKLHHIPEDRLFMTGAPTYDKWFDLTPSQERETFCNNLGLDPTRPYLAYLCSSTTISADEDVFVRELLTQLAQDETTRELQVVIRPHPLNAKIWEHFDTPNTAVYPHGGSMPEVNDARQQYFDTLYHSIGAFGINTTGFLDAAVAGKACVTLLAERYEETQIKRGHFHYLLDGNFIEVARQMDELIAMLRNLMNGQDPRATERRQFLQDFLRPHGLEKPAAPIFSEAVVLLGQGYSAAQIREKMPWLTS